MNEESIFAAALEKKNPDERAAFLDGVCIANPQLRANVESLLRAHDEAGEYLQKPAFGVEQTIGLSDSREHEGQVIGRYKLLQPIGEGGFGVVYMAEQHQPVRRKVALKIIKPGMDTKEVIARFEAERQALAMMDHPNIAKVLDGGTTDAGRPYFVMELVRGISITEFCDENNFTTRERLELFVPICQAIQHAHQKAIIHRDIKPSNVLVTMHDDKAVPKVIDFGIAKATQSELTAKTVFTQYQQFVGTPAYMSPEQAQMSGLDIDTRCDVYALGVLLYELLTGSTPFAAKDLLKGGYDEICRRIREQEPPRPSSRVSTLDADSRNSVAKSRKTDPHKLRGLIRGDLDWITMKAMEKDRTRRYETANGLALDVQRFLKNEPVSAVAPSSLYRLRKFAGRNRIAISTAVAFTVVLVVTATISSWQWFVASAERSKATSLARSESAAKEQAVAAKIESERLLDVSNLQLLQADWQRGNLTRVPQLLEDLGPRMHDTFEWRFWMRQMHQEVKTFRGHTSLVRGLAFSPEGEWIAASCDGGSARVWNLMSGRERYEPIVPAPGRTIAISPQGLLLTMGSARHGPAAKVWDFSTGRPLFDIEPLNQDSHINFASFSPDGERIVTGESDGVMRVIDVSEGKPAPILQMEELIDVSDVAYAPGGQHIASGSWNEPLGARLWDATTGKLVKVLPHTEKVNCVAFSPDGTRLVTAGWDGLAKVWDVSTGDFLFALEGHSSNILGVDFSPNGRRIATASADQTAKVWDAESGAHLTTCIGHTNLVWSVRFSPTNPDYIVTTSWDKTAKLWNVAASRDPATFRLSSPAGRVAFAPDGTWMVIADGSIVDTSTGRVKSSLLGHKGRATALAVSPDGRWTVTGHEDGSVRTYDSRSGDRLDVFAGDGVAIEAIAVSRDRRLIVTGHSNGSARVRSATMPGMPREVQASDNAVHAVAISPDGEWFVAGSGGAKRSVEIYSTATGEQLHSLRWDSDAMQSVAISPDGRRVVAGTLGAVAYVWDLGNPEPVLELKGHHSWVMSVSFSADGKRILTSGWGDGTTRLWETISGRELLALRNADSRHSSVPPQTFASISNDGLQIATWDHEGNVRVWRAATDQQIAAWDTDRRTAGQ